MQQKMSVQRNDEPNPLDSTGLCLLSLDGGGVRGLSTLYILKSIMDRLNNERKIASLPPKKSRLLFNLKGKVKGKFDSSMLETAIRETIKGSGISETDLFNDGNEQGCRTFVCTVDQNTKSIVRLRSYSLPDESNIPASICQAALATSAATTFFEPVRIGNRKFADGGFGANNPVSEVEGEAANIWCPESRDLKPLVKCFLSIGTGNPGIKAFEESLVKFLGQTVVNIATETEETEKRFIAKWRKHYNENRKNSNIIYCSYRTMPKIKWVVPFERNKFFTGRGLELSQLEELLFTEGGPKRIGVFGLGGVGKTSLTIELVYRIREHYKDYSIFWIPATNFESLQQAYVNICQHLQFPRWDHKNEDPKRLLQIYLSQASAGRWLLVFDNADDINMWTGSERPGEVSSRLRDYLPTSQDGRIIFTSRDRKTAYDLVQRSQHIVEVPDLSEDVAIDLLQKSIPKINLDTHKDDAKSLLEWLTYLPLAIVQAASYINKNDTSLATYLSLLANQEEQAIELLSENFEDDSRYRSIKNPVTTTWLISFEQIRLYDPLAAEYLSFMACVDSKDVPQSLLLPGSSPKMKIDAIGTLHAYSFVQKRVEDSSLDTHRLREYVTHAVYALNSRLIDQEEERRIDLAWKVGMCLNSDGRWNEAETLVIQVTNFRGKTLGQEHPQTLTSMDYLAVLLQSQGKYEAAEPLYKETLRLRKKVFSQEHSDTLTSMNNLARLLHSQGKYKAAQSLYRETLRLRKKVLGQEHPDTLASMNNLAVLLQSQGEYEVAEPLYKETLRLRKKVLSKEHPQTLASMNNLARLFHSQGKYEAARPLYDETLQLRKKVLGQEHPDTLASINNLAIFLQSQGNYVAAISLYKETLQLRKKVLGQEHPQTLASMNNLARFFHSQREYETAKPLYDKTIRLRKKVLGQEHPDTLASINNLTMLLQSQDKYKAAELLDEEIARFLSQEHPQTLGSMNELMNLLKFQGNYKAVSRLIFIKTVGLCMVWVVFFFAALIEGGLVEPMLIVLLDTLLEEQH
ncbi:hypothetical protein DL95DRAFT_404095 [Leptodontidium sp. 2 PMI_412]|nr:hypothetical protein DL95DRAFT_404095 [Leptodontidium sp. 2 PMI_412]